MFINKDMFGNFVELIILVIFALAVFSIVEGDFIRGLWQITCISWIISSESWRKVSLEK